MDTITVILLCVGVMITAPLFGIGMELSRIANINKSIAETQAKHFEWLKGRMTDNA